MAKRAKKHLKLTEQQIEAGKSAAGGFTKATLKGWGVPWPPPKGWKAALLAGREVPKAKKSYKRIKFTTEQRKAWATKRAADADHRAFDRIAARGL